MTDDMLGPSPMHINMCHMYMTDFAYDGPISLVPLSLSYPSSPVFKSINNRSIDPHLVNINCLSVDLTEIDE